MKTRIGITFFLAMIAASVFGCSCFFQPMSVKKILDYELVIDGVILNKEVVDNIPELESQISPGRISMEYFKYTIKIEKLISGNYAEELINVYSPTQGATCGVNYEIEERLYFYIYSHNNAFSTGLCCQNMKRKLAKGKYKKIIRKFDRTNKNRIWLDIDQDMIAEGKVMNNKAQGDWKFYHKDGSVESEGYFLNGRRHGEWKYYRNTKNSKELYKNLEEDKRKKVIDPNHIMYRNIIFEQGKEAGGERYRF